MNKQLSLRKKRICHVDRLKRGRLRFQINDDEIHRLSGTKNQQRRDGRNGSTYGSSSWQLGDNVDEDDDGYELTIF
jgi:hypothetical protein